MAIRSQNLRANFGVNLFDSGPVVANAGGQANIVQIDRKSAKRITYIACSNAIAGAATTDALQNGDNIITLGALAIIRGTIIDPKAVYDPWFDSSFLKALGINNTIDLWSQGELLFFRQYVTAKGIVIELPDNGFEASESEPLTVVQTAVYNVSLAGITVPAGYYPYRQALTVYGTFDTKTGDGTEKHWR